MCCFRTQGLVHRALLSILFICVWKIIQINTSNIETTTVESIELGEKVMQMLRSIEKNTLPLSANLRFSLILGQFLIKEKVRFYESTRYEAQTYFHIQKKIHALLSRPTFTELTNLQEQILGNIFRKNVLLLRPGLKEQYINLQVEYEKLVLEYDHVIGQGMPNATLSDECLSLIVTLGARKCQLRADCLNTFLRDIPTYGYQRVHQILMLYVFMHHECSVLYEKHSSFQQLAAQYCTQVYREQLVIREKHLPLEYRDLYLEQNVICGLFGFVEFLNWHHMELLSTEYAQIDDCYCSTHNNSNDCNCNNHMTALALVYYINGLLLLE